MRVLVATDSIGSLPSARAGALLATGWPAADVTVVPVGEAGAGFAGAVADELRTPLVSGLLEDRVVSVAHHEGTTVVAVEPTTAPITSGLPYAASSAALGRAVLHALSGSASPRRLLVDLSGWDVHDGGAGFLAALGARADVPLDRGVTGLDGVAQVDLARVRERLAGVELVGVVGAEERDRPLLGLLGITSLRSREAGNDPARLLRTDSTLETWSSLVAPQWAGAKGAGACGGLGFAVLALGGRLATGPELALAAIAAAAQPGMLDLVVTGCSVFDFARRGGGVVAEAAGLATSLLCPCIALAGRVLIGGREMRTMGIESAYAVGDSTLEDPYGADITEPQLLAVARRVGRSWRW